MKKVFVILAVCTVLGSCAENVEKLAGRHLDNAKEAFSMGNYNTAKQEIDSIKILYPKAFETRRQGIKLMQKMVRQRVLSCTRYSVVTI